jgi:hypothetical protein
MALGLGGPALAHAGAGGGAGAGAGAGVGAGSAVGALFHGSYDWYWNRNGSSNGHYQRPEFCYESRLVRTPAGKRREVIDVCE